MSGTSEPEEELTLAEQALDTHLELLRIAPPEPSATMIARIMHSARWQRTLRRPLLAIATVAAAAVDALRLLFVGGRRP